MKYLNKAFIDTNILIYAYSSTELEKKEVSFDIVKDKNIDKNFSR